MSKTKKKRKDACANAAPADKSRKEAKKRQLARALAPEDVRRGQYVSMLYMVDEAVPFFAEPESWRSPTPLRYLLLPCGGMTPMRVLDVCLPFVFVRGAWGGHATLDVRQHKLARVSRRFGRLAFKRLRQPP